LPILHLHLAADTAVRLLAEMEELSQHRYVHPFGCNSANCSSNYSVNQGPLAPLGEADELV
jgi:hypothetical protein